MRGKPAVSAKCLDPTLIERKLDADPQATPWTRRIIGRFVSAPVEPMRLNPVEGWSVT
jgi:hypothetical protein